MSQKPYSRKEFAGALAVNAAAKPFNVAVLVATMGAGVAVGGSLALALLVAVLVYACACARTFFDTEEADAVLRRVRAQRRRALADGGARRVDPARLDPPIRRRLLDARATETRIRDTIDRAELPYTEVSAEVEGVVALMEQSAARAQLLSEALAENPPDRIAGRIRELRGSGKTELVSALEQQLAVQQKMQAQLERFDDEMERTLVELDTVRSSLLSVSASGDAANQQRIAADVRGLRDEMGSLAAGMSEAFEQPTG